MIKKITFQLADDSNICKNPLRRIPELNFEQLLMLHSSSSSKILLCEILERLYESSKNL